MATYKIRIDYSSHNGWFVARLGDNAIWVLAQDQDQKFTISAEPAFSSRFQFSISEKSKCIDGNVEAFDVSGTGAVGFKIDIYVETSEDKIELSVDSEGEIRFTSDVDQMVSDNGQQRPSTLRLK